MLRIYVHTFACIYSFLHWDLPKAIALNGHAITGSCSASGYPRPDVRVIIPQCDYQQKSVHVGAHTNKAVFTMNATKKCEQIDILFDNKQNLQYLKNK